MPISIENDKNYEKYDKLKVTIKIVCAFYRNLITRFLYSYYVNCV